MSTNTCNEKRQGTAGLWLMVFVCVIAASHNCSNVSALCLEHENICEVEQ